jgi:hypothetical protein
MNQLLPPNCSVIPYSLLWKFHSNYIFSNTHTPTLIAKCLDAFVSLCVCVQTPGTHLAFVVIIRHLSLCNLIIVVCDQYVEPPTDWVILQTFSIVVAEWSSSPRLVSWHGCTQSDVSNRYHEATVAWSSLPRLSYRHRCPNQMWATGIMKQLSHDPLCHVCRTGIVAPIRCEQQVSWGYWRMILLATSIAEAWLPQSDVSNKYQRTVSLLQWINGYQKFNTLLCKGFIVASKDCTLPLIIWQVLFYLNMVETEHCTFFREYVVCWNVIFSTVDMLWIIFDNQ